MPPHDETLTPQIAAASLIAAECDLATRLSEMVVEIDALTDASKGRPLSPQEQAHALALTRELLVRLSQRDSLTAALVGALVLSPASPPPAPVLPVRPWWARAWLRLWRR